jgi:hypothetical protein
LIGRRYLKWREDWWSTNNRVKKRRNEKRNEKRQRERDCVCVGVRNDMKGDEEKTTVQRTKCSGEERAETHNRRMRIVSHTVSPTGIQTSALRNFARQKKRILFIRLSLTSSSLLLFFVISPLLITLLPFLSLSLDFHLHVSPHFSYFPHFVKY